MSLQRRLSLLEWARESQAWIIEDDYDSEYRFSGRPLEALQGIDTGDRVIYIGTFSKVLFPSLRLGYLVAPPKLLPGLLTMRGVIDTHPPILEQMVLADFMLEGHFNRHLRRMRVLYQQRRDALVDALTHHLGSTLTINVPEAGMHLVAWLHEGLSAVETSRLAGQYGLHLTPLVQSNPLRREGLIFGFAGFSSDELCAGVEKLAALLV